MPELKKFRIKYGNYMNELFDFETDDRDEAIEFFTAAQIDYAIAEIFVRGLVLDGGSIAVIQ